MSAVRPKTKQGQPDPDHQVFHRKHLVTTFWSLFAALITFVGTVAWQQRSGPQPVFVTNRDTAFRVITTSDTGLRVYLQDVVKELRALRSAPSVQQATPAAPTSPNPDWPTNPVQLPRFEFPDEVKGYLAAKLRTLATTSCPPSPVPPGKDVTITAGIKSAATAPKLTPFFVSVVRQDRPTSATLIFEEQYEPQVRNRVLVPAPDAPGSYVLEYGFYLRPELQTAYPPYYRQVCPLQVK